MERSDIELNYLDDHWSIGWRGLHATKTRINVDAVNTKFGVPVTSVNELKSRTLATAVDVGHVGSCARARHQRLDRQADRPLFVVQAKERHAGAAAVHLGLGHQADLRRRPVKVRSWVGVGEQVAVGPQHQPRPLPKSASSCASPARIRHPAPARRGGTMPGQAARLRIARHARFHGGAMERCAVGQAGYANLIGAVLGPRQQLRR